MNPSKIILSNGDHDEYQLGIFNQCVVFEFDLRGQVDVIDVASGDVVAIQDDEGWRWGREIGPYSKLFVQSVNMSHTLYFDSSTVQLRDTEKHDLRVEPLSTRVMNLLLRSGHKTVEDVANRTETWMRAMPGCGESSLEEIRLSLQAYGLDYREET